MKQTAVEWLYDNLKSHFEHDGDLVEVVQFSFDKAKEMEKQQQDEFAIEFAKWCAELKVWDNETYVNNTFEELLEKFKNK